MAVYNSQEPTYTVDSPRNIIVALLGKLYVLKENNKEAWVEPIITSVTNCRNQLRELVAELATSTRSGAYALLRCQQKKAQNGAFYTASGWFDSGLRFPPLGAKQSIPTSKANPTLLLLELKDRFNKLNFQFKKMDQTCENDFNVQRMLEGFEDLFFKLSLDFGSGMEQMKAAKATYVQNKKAQYQAAKKQPVKTEPVPQPKDIEPAPEPVKAPIPVFSVPKESLVKVNPAFSYATMAVKENVPTPQPVAETTVTTSTSATTAATQPTQPAKKVQPVGKPVESVDTNTKSSVKTKTDTKSVLKNN